jgi:hypothetical protein
MCAAVRRRSEGDLSDIHDGDPDDLDLVNTGLAMPRALKNKLDEIYKSKHYRSRNKLIIAVLKAYVAEYERERRTKK